MQNNTYCAFLDVNKLGHSVTFSQSALLSRAFKNMPWYHKMITVFDPNHLKKTLCKTAVRMDIAKFDILGHSIHNPSPSERFWRSVESLHVWSINLMLVKETVHPKITFISLQTCNFLKGKSYMIFSKMLVTHVLETFVFHCDTFV